MSDSNTANPDSAASTGVEEPSATSVLLVIGVLLVLGGGAFALYASGVLSRERITPSAVPSPTFSKESDGMSVGKIDRAALSKFLVSVGLPALKNEVPGIEKVACVSFHNALRNLRREQSADHYGKLGMYFHYYDLLDAAQACYERAADLNGDDFKWLHYQGVLAYAREDFVTAEKKYKESLELNNEYAATYMQLGRMYALLDRIDDSEQVFLQAKDLDPGNPYPYTELAHVQITRENYYAAEELSKKALEFRPEDHRAHSQLGRIYSERGDTARADYHIAMAGGGVPYSDPVPDDLVLDLRRETDTLAYLDMVVEKARAQKDWSRVIKTLQTIVERDPRVQYKIKLAEAWLRLERYEDARNYARAAIDQRPDIPASHLALARTYFAEKRFREALNLVKDALRVDAQSKQAYALKLRCHGEIALRSPPGDPRIKVYLEGLEAADRLVELDRGDAVSWHWKGKMLFNLSAQHAEKFDHRNGTRYGQECLKALEQSRTLNPSNPKLLRDLQDARTGLEDYVKRLQEQAVKDGKLPQE